MKSIGLSPEIFAEEQFISSVISKGRTERNRDNVRYPSVTLNQIGKRLETSCYGPGNVLEEGINDLAQIFFWYIEQVPDIRKNKVSCNHENSTSPI